MAQPMRSSGWRPLTIQSNARGTSGTRPGKRCAISGGGVPEVSEARQTTMPPVSMNFAVVSHGVRSGVRRAADADGRYPSRSGSPVADRRPPRAAAGWCGAQNCRRRNARSRAAGSEVGTSALPVQGNNSVVAIATKAGAAIAAAQTERNTRWRRRWIRSPVATITASPDISSATPAPPTTLSRLNRPAIRLPSKRRRDGEEIDELARQRIDRRPVDDRRLLGVAGEPAGVEDHQQHDARHRQHEAAEQPAPVHGARTEIVDRRPRRQRQAHRRGAARSDRAAPARRSPAAHRADRATSACAGRARSRPQIRRQAATARSQPRSSAATGRPRSTRQTTRCAGSGR